MLPGERWSPLRCAWIPAGTSDESTLNAGETGLRQLGVACLLPRLPHSLDGAPVRQVFSRRVAASCMCRAWVGRETEAGRDAVALEDVRCVVRAVSVHACPVCASMCAKCCDMLVLCALCLRSSMRRDGVAVSFHAVCVPLVRSLIAVAHVRASSGRRFAPTRQWAQCEPAVSGACSRPSLRRCGGIAVGRRGRAGPMRRPAQPATRAPCP